MHLPILIAENSWASWWLPTNYSVHGRSIDSLFLWIFWITAAVFLITEGLLVIFLVKYRHRPGRKGVFTHGHRKLEMIWTIIPATILVVLALGSKRVWDNYRYADFANDPNRATILVIGEQFKWNTIYPGPDGKLGRYLVFPKPTDTRWPDGKQHDGVAGPAFLPYDKAVQAINAYNTANPLGKDFSDPDGKDDIWQGARARVIDLPVDRPIEVQLTSKDVIHDFFLPNFRVKLDAVPGMRGKLFFIATETSKQHEAEAERVTYSLDELQAKIDSPEIASLIVDIDQNNPAASYDAKSKTWRYVDADKKTILRAGMGITQPTLDRLRANGFTQVTMHQPGTFELICDQLCGAEHYTMTGQVRILSQEEYNALHYDRPFVSTGETGATK